MTHAPTTLNPAATRVKPSRFCYRAVEFQPVNDVGDGRTLEGYAAVFESPTRIDSREGQFDEVISRGAFNRTISQRMPKLQFDHGLDARTGTVPIGAIEELREDDHGLYVRARLFDNAVVEPIRQAIEGHAIDGMSFRFRVNDDTWTPRNKRVDGGEVDLRAIREAEVFELGPVVFPAYDATTVGVRSLIAARLDSNDEALRILESLAADLREHITIRSGDPTAEASEPAAAEDSTDQGDDTATPGDDEPQTTEPEPAQEPATEPDAPTEPVQQDTSEPEQDTAEPAQEGTSRGIALAHKRLRYLTMQKEGVLR